MLAAYSVSITKSTLTTLRASDQISVHECTSDFTRAVSTEVHENQRIAVFHCRIWLTFCTNNGRFHELVVFVASISCLQTSNGSIGLDFTCARVSRS